MAVPWNLAGFLNLKATGTWGRAILDRGAGLSTGARPAVPWLPPVGFQSQSPSVTNKTVCRQWWTFPGQGQGDSGPHLRASGTQKVLIL